MFQAMTASFYDLASSISSEYALPFLTQLSENTLPYFESAADTIGVESDQGVFLMQVLAACWLAPKLFSLTHRVLYKGPQKFLVDLNHHGMLKATKNLVDFTPSPAQKQQIIDQIFDVAMWIPGVERAFNYYTPVLLLKLLPGKEVLVDKEHSTPDNLVISGAIYATQETREKTAKALHETATTSTYENPMHGSQFPVALARQNELADKFKKRFAPPEMQDDIHFMTTTGGSMSIMNAMSTYITLCRRQHRSSFFTTVSRTLFGASEFTPIILVSKFRHPAYDKAAKVFNAKIVEVDCDPKTGAMLASGIEKAIIEHGRANIACIVTSNPNYANGVSDPIPQIAGIADDNDIPCHVDSCLGGPVTAFDPDKRFHVDFATRGVTSISLDPHKGLETIKGLSVLLKKRKYVSDGVHAYLSHPCGAYITPGLRGSTSAFETDSASAQMEVLGDKYYEASAKATIELTQQLAQTINEQVPGIKIIGNTDELINVFAFEIDHDYWKALNQRPPNIHVIAEKLTAASQAPINGHYDYVFNWIDGAYHLCITPRILDQNKNQPLAADLTNALKRIIETTHPTEKPVGRAKSYGYLNVGPLPLPTRVQEIIGGRFEENKELVRFRH